MTVTVQNLSFSYEKNDPLLEGISFSIAQGEFVGIFGPNGGGKTTLLKLLLGLLTPTEGKIELLGKPPEEVRAKIGYVPQRRQFDLQFPISVMEVVLQGCLSIHRGWGSFSEEAKERAWEALKKVSLEDKADAPFRTLSGGQIQRTLIARALATQPQILLLDEATVGIDPHALHDFFQFLLEIRGEITILLVTHDLQAIARQMSQLLCIHHRLTLFSPEQVCEHFALGLYHPPITMKKKKENGPT